MAPLIMELKKHPEVESYCCITAQHRQMLDSVLGIFNIKPDYDLNIMQDVQTLTDITASVIRGLSPIFSSKKFDLCLVHGDTTTTFAAALAAFYAGVRVGHVEAGLRTFNKKEPFPEEINRVLTSSISDLHFAPTEGAKKNLLKENIPEDKIFVTGNTVIDALKYTVGNNYKFDNTTLRDLDFTKKIITLTAHRRENLGDGLKNICRAAIRIVNNFDDIEIVYPVHLNPLVSKTVFGLLQGINRVHLVAPLNITDMHNLMARSHLILTDSGGLQEEAPSLNVPVIVLRNVTERPEGLIAGTLMLAGVLEDDIYAAAESLLTDTKKYKQMADASNPFGDGTASKQIIKAILHS
jgi:UDP-N-acetylglucosamine 2-epimerase (non-hydrolysing)